ncbi:MAG: MBOAT family protein, partial [Cyanobacteria bacterium HKST-UBA01]|nr:MBOAT family protein [Cyanobacteria bacterium HKST-UBA01]
VSYLVFFPCVFALYWLLPSGRPRQAMLLVASYFFYMSWLPQYGLLLAGLTLVNYMLGWAIDRYRSKAKAIFALGLLVNLGSLCYFKYANFVLQSIEDLAGGINSVFGSQASSLAFPTLHIILPLAISFFAFEFIHYLFDIYRGDKPIKNPLEFALFASFFPSSIAGPIKRYQDFIEKLERNPVLNVQIFNSGMALLLQGLFKKVALADNLAVIANQGFQNSGQLGAYEAWIAVLAFTFQIYFDFSGYTDMGRGSARLLGIELPKNFNLPYIASDLSDFWKRWHISLSTWLRDYLYIPLGGNRCSDTRKNFNLLLTMLLGGLWHGAAWHFVIWGALHGTGLIVSHGYSSAIQRSEAMVAFHKNALGKTLSITLTFLFVVLTWVFFRAETVPQAMQMLSSMVSPGHSTVLSHVIESSVLLYAIALYVLYACLFTPAMKIRPQWMDRIRDSIFTRQSIRIPCYAGVYMAAIALSAPQLSAFIYFQF